MESSRIFENLNPAQKEAVECLTGPLLILAGAGSGKTRVLTSRMANLIMQGEATASEVLAVTFTNKAAKEMAHRIESLLQDSGIPIYDRMWISTFHSSCARILREDIHHLGYTSYFVIYDDGDQLSVLKKIADDLNLNDKVFPAKVFRHQISEAKMLGLTPKKVRSQSALRLDETALEVYELYEEELRRANALDFDDLLLKTYELFQNFPDVVAKYQERFRFIMVDEYQDTNHIQYLLVKRLAETHRNLCVVGDEDQSIYSWRGADIRNILDFEKDFPEAKVVKLEENYRSSKNIVEAASKLIAKNSQRKEKTLFTKNDQGSKITVNAENNEYDEGRFVVHKIQDLAKAGFSLNDIAIFYRTNAQSRVLEEQMRSYSIPYRIFGSVKFYERKEVKDLICYLRLALNPTDDVAFYRVVNNPSRGIGKTSLEVVAEFAMKNKVSALQAAYEVSTQRQIHSGAANKLQAFFHFIHQLKNDAPNIPPSELYLKILDTTQYVQRLRDENTPEAMARVENLEAFQNALVQFEEERGDEATLQAFLEEMALISDADKDTGETEAVTLMTLHLSKGLEFKNVFVVGLEDGLFPSSQSLNGSDPHRLEEERRLCYVGMTRARINLFLSYAKSRRVYGQMEYHPPSQFLAEIPVEYLMANTPLQRPAFMERYDKYLSVGPARTETKNKKSQDPFPDYDDQFSEDSFASDEGPQFTRGQKVRHPTFGVGTVFQIEGQGDTQKVSVLFADKSLKKFMTKHARLVIQG